MIFITVILVIIAGAAKAVMDTLQFHFYTSVFKPLNEQYWNPSRSWKNKYSDLQKLTLKRGPQFLTDGWHLFQSIFLTCIFAAMVFYTPIFKVVESDHFRFIIDFVILRSVFGAAFVLFYNYLLIRK
jgi:hypothetical protein